MTRLGPDTRERDYNLTRPSAEWPAGGGWGAMCSLQQPACRLLLLTWPVITSTRTVNTADSDH